MHTCFAGEDSACPPGPPLRTRTVLLLPSSGVYPFLGEPGDGGENLMNIGFFEHFSRAVIMELSHGFSYPRMHPREGLLYTAGFCSEIPFPEISLVTDRGITRCYSEVDLAALFFNTCFIALMLSI